ncbi:transmembrane protein 223 [Augochlora pura]
MFNLLYLRNSCTKINVINKLQFVYQGLKGNNKVKGYTFCKAYHTSLNNPVKVNHSRCREVDLNANTNIQNNVLLYKMESNFYYFLRFFATGSVLFSGLLMYTTWDENLKSFFNTDKSLREYLVFNGLNLVLFAYGGLIGPLIFLVSFVTSKRFVKYIILHKGGDQVSVITYHLFKNQTVLTIPTCEVQSVVARRENKSYVPMKIKGKRFFYLVDSSGTFLNETLFDNTVGVGKRWQK